MVDDYWKKVGEDVEEARNKRARWKAQNHRFNPKGRRPGQEGEFLWVCLACHDEHFEHFTKINRAARMRCRACGSLTYEPKTDYAKGEMAELRGVRESVSKKGCQGKGKFAVSNPKRRIKK